MKLFTKSWFLPLVITLIILVIGSIFVMKFTSSEETVSTDEIRDRIEQMYGGTVSNLILKNDQYIAKLERQNGLYEVTAEASKGTIMSITLLEQPDVQQLSIKSKESIQSIVSKEYKGTIERIVLSSNSQTPFYSVDIAKDETLVTLTIDATTGTVVDSKEKQSTAEQALINKEQAITIAKTQLTGEVQYTTYENTSDGGYYLIEIESEDDREAVIQVHGVSGDILSVTWDDQEEDDDDD
jgi:uncharacterized membrane protein YkoI